MKMDKFVRGKVLGKGSFGSAILVTNKVDGKNYVIKEVDMSRMPKAERDAAEQEAKLLMALNHPNIVRCLECFTHMNKLCIVMDWCSEGDLYSLLQKRRGQQLSEETIIDWLVQMCLGLKHVHDRKILHRDIKTQNVFMSSNGLLKLGDFGVSKVLNSTYQLATTAVGTPYYLSPEICQNRKYNQKSDIWSLGCVLYELAALKHAFEAPNMRALIQKIIKGSYPPMPATRSRELRELCDRMLTLDWNKRPSINEILATPLLKARIQKFLGATLQAHEFSHTIIHGRPKPGQLVVGAGPAPAAPGAAPAAAAGAAATPAPGVAAGLAPPKFGVAAEPKPVAPPLAAGVRQSVAAAGRPNTGAGGAPARPAPAPAPGRAGVVAAGARAHLVSPGGPAAGVRASAAAGPARPGAAAAPAAAALPGGAAAALRQAQEAAVAARAKASEAAKQREDAMMALAAKRAADAEANAKRELERAKAREVAALGAQREIERLRLEEARRKLEADRARMEGDRRRKEAAKVEEERRAKAAEDARVRQSMEDARRQREAEAKRKKAEEEARKRDAEKAAKEKEREDMRAKIAQQRKDYQDRQTEAARNRAAVEQNLGRGAGGGVAKPQQEPRQQRRQWSPPRVDEQAVAREREREERGAAEAAARAGREREDAMSAEQRRAVWEEQRAAAERNRRAVQEAERHGGLAEFLGVPSDRGAGQRAATPEAAGVRRPSGARAGSAGSGSRPGSGAKAGAPAAADISPEARRQAYLEMRAAAERNRAAVEGRPITPPTATAAGAGGARPVSPLLKAPGAGAGSRPVTPPPAPPSRPTDPWAAKMARLEEERRKREQEILEFQKQHWQEVREARERNKRQIMAEVRGGTPDGQGVAPGGARGPSPQRAPPARAHTPPNGRAQTPPHGAPSGGAGAGGRGAEDEGDDDNDMDFAAMVKDMQDVLLDDGAGGRGPGGDDDDDDVYNDEKHAAALQGQFMLNGEVVHLPGVRESDSLALKVEALRVFLESKLGTDPFLKVYRRLESLSIEDDEGEVSAEFLAVLGQERLPYLQLVHQLIVCEENMHALTP